MQEASFNYYVYVYIYTEYLSLHRTHPYIITVLNCMSGKTQSTLKYDSAKLCSIGIFTLCYTLLFWVLSSKIYYYIAESLCIITAFLLVK